MSPSYERSAGGYYRPSLFGGFTFFPPIIKALLISNAVIWVLLDVFLAPLKLGGVPIFFLFSEYLALWPIGPHFWPWQLLTYMFIHGGFWHLFFNMLALWMFGSELEHLWGSRRFLVFYLLCGIGGAATNLLVAPLLGQVAPTVGASGAVFGVLLAFGMMFPDRPIYLWLLLPIRAKYFIAAYIGLELYFGVTGTTDGVAHFAHLGGAAAGFLYVTTWRRGLTAKKLWARVSGVEDATPVESSQSGRPAGPIQDATFYDIHSGKPMDNDEEITQEVIDAILDKIGRAGYQSLSDKEKRILNEASRKFH